MSAHCELLSRQLSSSKHRQAQAKIVTTSEAATSQQQNLLPTNTTFAWMLGDEPVNGTPTVSGNERRRSSATLALYLTKYYFYQRREHSSTTAAIYRDPVVVGANSDVKSNVNCTNLTTATVAFETTPWNQLGNSRQLEVALDDCVNLRRQQDDANNTTSVALQTIHNSSVSPSLSSSSSTASSPEPKTATSCSRLVGCDRGQSYLASRVQGVEPQQGTGSVESHPDKRQQIGCHFIQNSDSAFSLNSSASTQTAADSRQTKGALEYQDSTSNRNQIAQTKPSRLVTHHQDEASEQRTQSYLSSWFQSSRLANTSSAEYHLRRNSSPVEEQLRRLLDLEPLPDNQRTQEQRGADRNKWPEWKQVVTSKSAQQIQRKFSLDIEGAAMKRKSSELAPTGKLGNNSDERNGYSYKQSSSISKQLSPDDRLMIFMLASRSTTSNTQVERNAQILKWLNNCRSAY